jgi:hypothetical protein
LLERFSYSPASFDALRADAYEKQLAAHSLDSLELLYSTLLVPGLTLEKAQSDCPTWPKGPYAGKLPAINTLSEIKQRLLAESTLNDLGRTSAFLEKIRARAANLPAGQQAEVLDSVITMVGDELIQAKLKGSPIAASIEVVDRLLNASSAKTRASQEDQKIKLRERAEERQGRKLKLEREKFEFDAATECLKKLPDLKAISDKPKMSPEEKTRAIQAILFPKEAK